VDVRGFLTGRQGALSNGTPLSGSRSPSSRRRDFALLLGHGGASPPTSRVRGTLSFPPRIFGEEKAEGNADEAGPWHPASFD
jgi:hypothetical protein